MLPLSETQTNQAFQFRAGYTSCLTFEFLQHDLALVDQQLMSMVSSAPDFFQGAVVVIDLSKLSQEIIVEFAELKSLMRKHGIVTIGVSGGTKLQQHAAKQASLAVVNLSKTIRRDKEAPVAWQTKLVTQPIRSGVQIYAKSGDLIVTNQVSSGAELLADGHIHIYGCLRGRVLAGVNGNEAARIFCRALDAELIAIAGCYLTRDDLTSMSIPADQLLQIHLENDKLKIETL